MVLDPGSRVEAAELEAGLEQRGGIVALPLADDPGGHPLRRRPGCGSYMPHPCRQQVGGHARQGQRHAVAEDADRAVELGRDRKPGRRGAQHQTVDQLGMAPPQELGDRAAHGVARRRSPDRGRSCSIKAATSSAQSSRRNGRRLRMPRPWPRWSRRDHPELSGQRRETPAPIERRRRGPTVEQDERGRGRRRPAVRALQPRCRTPRYDPGRAGRRRPGRQVRSGPVHGRSLGRAHASQIPHAPPAASGPGAGPPIGPRQRRRDLGARR